MQTDRIKLLEFVTLFAIGGTERQVVNLSRALDLSRFELYMGCLRQAGEFLKEIEAREIPISEYRIRSFYHPKTFVHQLRLARHLIRNRIQILHSYNFYSNVFAIPAARLAGTPVVVASIRDTGVYLTSPKKALQKWICRFATHILVNAEAVRRWLVEEGYPADKITVIGNGIDLERFAQKPGGTRLREELGLPSQVPLVAVLSRLNPLKGIESFLSAAVIVARRFPDARFLIVGDGFSIKDGAIVHDDTYRREMTRYAARLGLEGRVVFTGFRLDVPSLLSEVAVSVLPSLSEGLSNTLLESMAAGVPVVATRVGGNPEAIEDGVSGLLVPPRDPEALARAIGLLLENRRLAFNLGEAGRRRVVERFSLERMVSRTEAFYLESLKKATCRGKSLGGDDGKQTV
jgi:glycosyltransferase involved in cell wall biosynthesis